MPSIDKLSHLESLVLSWQCKYSWYKGIFEEIFGFWRSEFFYWCSGEATLLFQSVKEHLIVTVYDDHMEMIPNSTKYSVSLSEIVNAQNVSNKIMHPLLTTAYLWKC